jgi:hypothetical protein
MKSKSLIFGLILLMAIIEGCSMPYLGPGYGFVTLRNSEGEEFYIKREVRGQNYDVVVISNNKDFCSNPNPRVDYIFRGQSNSLYFKLENNVLHLYSSAPDNSSKDNYLPVKIKQYELSTGDFWRIDEIKQENGLIQLTVPIDDRLRCS